MVPIPNVSRQAERPLTLLSNQHEGSWGEGTCVSKWESRKSGNE